MSIAEKLITIAENEQNVYEAGRQAEYDEFWDNFQRNGNRTTWNNAFASVRGSDSGWNDSNYNPKYDFISENSERMFWATQITHIRKSITLKDGAYTSQMFGSSPIVTIPLLKFEGNVWNFTNTFLACTKLKNIMVEGLIYKEISFSDSPLTVESAKSIINALCDYSGGTSAYTVKVTFSSATKSLLEAEGNTAPNGMTWLEYAYSKGWNY